MLQPHQERVIVEAGDLDEKLLKLRDFTGTEVFKYKLPFDEQQRLLRQMAYMSGYSAILHERIRCFDNGADHPALPAAADD